MRTAWAALDCGSDEQVSGAGRASRRSYPADDRGDRPHVRQHLGAAIAGRVWGGELFPRPSRATVGILRPDEPDEPAFCGEAGPLWDRAVASPPRDPVRSGLFAGGEWIRTFSTAPNRQRFRSFVRDRPDRPPAQGAYPSSCWLRRIPQLKGVVRIPAYPHFPSRAAGRYQQRDLHVPLSSIPFSAHHSRKAASSDLFEKSYHRSRAARRTSKSLYRR